MKKRILSLFPLVLLMVSVLCVPALALEESDVQAAVAESSKEAVTGNVLIWFLCAVAFLKVSQKIDSFLASLGISVGRTGGSLMAEAMIAARGVSMLVRSLRLRWLSPWVRPRPRRTFSRAGAGCSAGRCSCW